MLERISGATITMMVLNASILRSVKAVVEARVTNSRTPKRRASLLDPIDRAVLDLPQDGIGVCERPSADAGDKLGLLETDEIARVGNMLNFGVPVNLYPMFDPERLGVAVTLCAMRMLRDRSEEVVQIVNGFDDVVHNHERDHPLNTRFAIGVD